MRANQDFSPVSPDETVNLSFDFTNYLASGDSIASIFGWNCTVAEESLVPDPSAGSRPQGAPSLSGAIVTQTISGCLPGVTYVMEAVVDTLGGEQLSLWALAGCLAVGQ